MRFILEIDTDAKRNTKKLLDRLIERASDAVMKERTVKTVEVRGKKVSDDDKEEA